MDALLAEPSVIHSPGFWLSLEIANGIPFVFVLYVGSLGMWIINVKVKNKKMIKERGGRNLG